MRSPYPIAAGAVLSLQSCYCNQFISYCNQIASRASHCSYILTLSTSIVISEEREEGEEKGPGGGDGGDTTDLHCKEEQKGQGMIADVLAHFAEFDDLLWSPLIQLFAHLVVSIRHEFQAVESL